MTTTAIVNADMFRLAANFMAKNDVRFYLNGIAIQPHESEGAYIVATDGHVLGVFHDAGAWAPTEPIVVQPSKDLLKACKAYKREVNDRSLQVTDERQTVRRDTGEEVMSEPLNLIDGRFPEWGRVVPKELPEEPHNACFDMALMKRFEAVALGHGKMPTQAPMTVHPSPNEGSALVLTPRHDFVGVIMPMRAESAGALMDVPKWLTGESKTQEDHWKEDQAA